MSATQAALVHLELDARKADIESMQLFMQADINLIEQNDKHWLNLMRAIENNHIESAKSLINQTTVNLQDNSGFSALMLAAYYGRDEIFNSLINAGADLNLINKNGDSALIFAARMGKAKIVDLLIKKGANLNLQNRTGVSALIIAAEKRKTDIVTLLINAGADLNLQNNKEASALIAAANEEHIDIIKLLIDKGADASVLNFKKKDFEGDIHKLIDKKPLMGDDKKRLVELYIIFRTIEEADIINCIKRGLTAFFKPECVYREKIKVAEDLLKALNDSSQGFSGNTAALRDGLLNTIYECCFSDDNVGLEPVDNWVVDAKNAVSMAK